MKRRCLALCLIALFVLATGCIAEDFPSKENEHLGGSDAGDTSDISDAGDATDTADATDASDGGGDATDGGGDSGDAGDGGDLPQNCSTPSDCDAPGDRQGVDCVEDTCVYECEASFGDCDGDISNGCEVELNQPEYCGACDSVCTSGEFNYAPTCEDPTQQLCGTDPNACAPGFYDISDEVEGCEYECEFQSDEDVPDADGIDQNCDGIDGTVADAVFVSEDGNDGNTGLEPNQAVASLSQALSIASTEGRSYLLVSAGTFQEVVTLEDGVSIYGGYDKGTWEHDADQFETLIEPPAADQHEDTMHFRTVIADGLTEPTVLDGLTIEGFNAQSDGPEGSSTYVMWARNSTDLSLNNSVLRAGDAARGANGGPGANGDTLTCNAEGGAGGQENSGDIVCNGSGQDGQVGNAGSSQASGGQGGSGGNNDCSGSLNAGGCNAGDGTDGSPGDNGDNGDHGSTGSAPGTVEADLWAPSNGTSGGAGQNGTGGGGGGAGGDCGVTPLSGSTASNAHYRGGKGGHGGEGGCGGEGGGNGKQGGGSFGLFTAGSVVTLTDVTIERARGGDGGDGGDGGFRGETSNSSQTNGYDPSSNHASGGDGGLGGDGGSGGGGAGGCGGPSVGIAYVGDEPTQTNVNFPAAPDSATGGTGGEHGDPTDNTIAPTGCAGTVTSTLEF